MPLEFANGESFQMLTRIFPDDSVITKFRKVSDMKTKSKVYDAAASIFDNIYWSTTQVFDEEFRAKVEEYVQEALDKGREISSEEHDILAASIDSFGCANVLPTKAGAGDKAPNREAFAFGKWLAVRDKASADKLLNVLKDVWDKYYLEDFCSFVCDIRDGIEQGRKKEEIECKHPYLKFCDDGPGLYDCVECSTHMGEFDQ